MSSSPNDAGDLRFSRRGLLASGAGAALATTVGTRTASAESADSEPGFQLKYAPHFGMFRHSAGDDLVAQLEFAADQGFRAWEDNGMRKRSVEEQERVAKAMDRLGIEMGVFVAVAQFGKPAFVLGKKADEQEVLKEIESSIEVAKRVRAKWMTVVPGRFSDGGEWDYQTANCIDLLRRCSDLLEPHGLVMVLEPLNPWRNHAGLFLTKVPQAYQICRAVDSPACKILDDLYHQQITEGNLIPNLDAAWDEIAYLQVGDTPGRNEPGTGEINYLNVFKHVHSKGFTGIVGMEHGNSMGGAEGERAVIEAYHKVDHF